MNLQKCVHKYFGTTQTRNQGGIDENVQPVVILKPFANALFERLEREFPDKFELPVPHTTRERRENETEGREYHFLNQSTQEFIEDCDSGMYVEAGMFKGNGYGTRLETVTDVMAKGKRPLLPIDAKAVKRVQAAGLNPIVICVALESCTSHLIWEMAIDLTVNEAKEQLQAEAEVARQFITAEVEGNTKAEVYEKVKEIVFASS